MTWPSNPIKSILLFWVAIFIITACQENKPVQVDQNEDVQVDRIQLIQEVEDAVWDFHRADTSINPDKVIGLLWPECTMLIDGNRINYQDISQGVRQYMASLSLFHTEWTDLKIIPVSNDAAIASFIFRDSIIDQSDNLTLAKGPNTFLWQKRDGEWRILYGDADHY